MAEITLAHIRQLAFMFGWPVGEDHVLALLNLGGHAYGMWMRMMQAGEDFIKSKLPKVLSKRAATRSNERAIRADNCYSPIYQTSAQQNLT